MTRPTPYTRDLQKLCELSAQLSNAVVGHKERESIYSKMRNTTTRLLEQEMEMSAEHAAGLAVHSITSALDDLDKMPAEQIRKDYRDLQRAKFQIDALLLKADAQTLQAAE